MDNQERHLDFFSILFTELRSFVGQIIQTEKLNILAVQQNHILLPPTYNRYLAWGFSDQSLRICNYESEKAQAVFENLESSEIFCACSPNSRTIITAGISTVSAFIVSTCTIVIVGNQGYALL